MLLAVLHNDLLTAYCTLVVFGCGLEADSNVVGCVAQCSSYNL